MKNKMEDVAGHRPPLQILSFIVEKILPRGVRRQTMDALNERSGSISEFVPESVVMVADGYRVQILGAFNKTVVVAEIGAIVFCFAAASVSLPLVFVLGALLVALTLRDAHTYPLAGSAPDAPRDPELQEPPLYLDSAGDAATAAVFLLASQALMMTVSPSLVLPSDSLLRGAFICLPLLAVLRMVLRPRSEAGMRFEGSNMTPAQIYKTTWRLNLLWISACLATLWTNPRMPAFLPSQEFFLTFIPVATFCAWLRLQQDAFTRDSSIETLAADWKKKDLARKREKLMKGIPARDPVRNAYAVLETLFFLVLALPLAAGLWQWMAGRVADVDMFRLGFNLAILATLALSWNYVKGSNRAAARALIKDG